MLTRALKFALAGKIGPFTFLPAPNYLPDYAGIDYGLYIHVPFCESVCPFCPYYKTLYDERLFRDYIDALLAEIDMVSRRIDGGKATTLYFGGGSPALCAESLGLILEKVRERFSFDGNAGIELHPRDVTPATLKRVKDAGIDMVSVGVQSFQRELLAALGRTDEPPLEALKLASSFGFSAVDVDLIFGIPGQTPEALKRDFLLAAKNGATQVSTYPFIDFSYAANARKPLGRGQKKKMLDALLEVSAEAGFERTSVWTFGKASAPRYSSITRDNFVGFGPSATSLGKMDFKMNTFSVAEYIASARSGTVPTALRMRFTERTRGMYWLFWNCYTGALDSSRYRTLFGRSLKGDYGAHLAFAERLGWVVSDGGASPTWRLTPRGSYLFHLVEQEYTRQYIDSTWRASLNDPWPASISLH